MEKSEEIVLEGLQKKANLNVYQDQKHRHWAKKAENLRPVENVDKTQTKIDAEKQKT